MSTTTNIVCLTCKEKLWIGQSNYIYLVEEHIMKKLDRFLQKHRTTNGEPENVNHKLAFIDEHWDWQYDKGWKNFEE